MSRCCVLCIISLVLAACNSRTPQIGSESVAGIEGRAAQNLRLVPAAARGPDEGAPAARKSLAYEHEVTVELKPGQISERLAQLQDTCMARAEFACSVLDVSLQQDRVVPRGNVRLRVAPAAVQPLMQLAASGGEITSRATHAEDLAQPVADTEREIAQLVTHRDRLTQLQKDRQLNVDQLIRLSSELSRVQARLDELNTQHANLQRRIDTELLSIELRPPSSAYSAQQTPVREALRSFGTTLLASLAQLISFIAAVLPWLLVVIPGLIALRVFWRAGGRWLARRYAGRSPP